MLRWNIIQFLINVHAFKSYLEIGVFTGWNWNQIECEEKVGVDPNTDLPIPQGGEFFRMTSDEYFAQTDKKFDIIFLDGHHTEEQVYKDILNAHEHLNPGGRIVIHDCNPATEDMTKDGSPHGEWTGTTYLGWIKYREDSKYVTYTVDTDYGIGIVDTSRETMDMLLFGKVDWETFSDNREELLNLITIEEFKKKESR